MTTSVNVPIDVCAFLLVSLKDGGALLDAAVDGCSVRLTSPWVTNSVNSGGCGSVEEAFEFEFR